MPEDGWRLSDFLESCDSVSGKTLGRYQVLELIQQGGMGLVYAARDTRLDRPVALKLLPRWAAGHRESRERLRQEAKIAASVSHRNIVIIHELALEEGFEFIVMEHLAGRPMSRIVPPAGIPFPKAWRYAVQLADALAFLHARGIVHRDVKLSNVVVEPSGRLALLDFGLAAHLGSPIAFEGAGSSMWLAPEEQRLRPALPDPRSEIFSFGLLLHQMLSGRHPFGPGAAAEVAAAICQRAPSAPPPHTPRRMVAIVERCLAKEPVARYPSMQAVLEDLEACGQACGVRPAPLSTASGLRPRSR